MNFRQTRSRGRTDPRLELTALIDVVFLLLIFFLITTSFVRDEEQQLPLNLPKANAGQAAKEGQKITVFVQKDGGITLNGEQIRAGEVRQRMKALFEEDGTAELNVKGDRDTSYGSVTSLIDEARGVGFEKVNLVVKRKRAP